MKPFSKTVLAALCCALVVFPSSIWSAPSLSDSGESDIFDDLHHHRLHHHSPAKDAYVLLKSIRKVNGPDGLTPACTICDSFFVDANTYDYFCLPESEGINGAVCDSLTILGTTSAQNINLGCKILQMRRPIICK